MMKPAIGISNCHEGGEIRGRGEATFKRPGARRGKKEFENRIEFERLMPPSVGKQEG